MKHYALYVFFLIFVLHAEEHSHFSHRVDSFLQYARTLIQNGHYQEALPYFEQALSSQPNDTQIMFEYANALNTLNQTEKALSLYQHLLKQRPHDTAILYNTAYTLKKLGYIDVALPYYHAVLRQNPHHIEAHFSLSLAYLANGDFKKGWAEYEWRLKRSPSPVLTSLKKPRWNGQALTDKTLFLYAEQGLGDTFQFIRYAQFVKEKYQPKKLIVAVQKPLYTIISRCCPFIDSVITTDQIPNDFDVHAPLMSLPYILDTQQATIPAEIPYIIPDQELVQQWGKKLAHDTSIKIGICWQGNNNYSTPFLRAVVAEKSITLSALTSLSNLPHVTLYSLQRETGTDQLATLPDGFRLHVFDDTFDRDHGRFMDTAAVMCHLDLIITIDTSIAHLAGAIGTTPVWVLLPEPADWRWMLHRSDSPWYPSVRLFRQPKSGNWESVLETIVHALQQFIQQKNKLDTLPAHTIPSSIFAVDKNSADAHAHFTYGSYLAEQDDAHHYHEAWYHLHRATTLEPHNFQWLFFYATFCCRIGRFHDALEAYSTILKQNPTAIPALYNSGYTLKIAGKIDLAIAVFKKIIALKPDYEPARLALAFAFLAKGDFTHGWKAHEWNLRHQGKYAAPLKELIRTHALAGKHILLTPEGGFGDTFHFIRYAQRLHEMGAFVHVAAQKELLPILSHCPYINHLIAIGSTPPPCDASATLMSLPAIFEDTETTLPISIPYMFAPAERIAYWKEYLKHDTSFKIGICWQPSAHNDQSRLPIARRNIPLSLLHQLSSLPGVTLYSLQQKEGIDQLLTINEPLHIHTFDTTFDGTVGSFIDTAAVIHNLDLIITADTAVAHLAGAMGKTTWLLLPYVSDWRWIHERDNSPWYPTMRIFKQPQPFDWESVINAVAQAYRTEFLSS